MAAKKKAKKTASNANESKADKFKRLASLRTTKGINAMRGLQKLSNRNNYEFTDEQINKIIGVLKEELEAVHAAFTRKGGSEKETFQL